jgi:hypothetical protein
MDRAMASPMEDTMARSLISARPMRGAFFFPSGGLLSPMISLAPLPNSLGLCHFFGPDSSEADLAAREGPSACGGPGPPHAF